MKNILLTISALILFCITETSYAGERLIFAIDLVRHGDRNPILEIPKSPHDWRGGLGELTPEGMNQEFRLGLELRKKYIDQNHLLPAKYSPGTIYVRSTDVNRTLMSAQSLLIGLYPPGTGPMLRTSNYHALPSAYQPIPIHTLPKEEDHLLYGDNKYMKFLKNTPSETWRAMTSKYQQKIGYWKELTGVSIDSPTQLILLSDNLSIRKIHQVSLPNGMTSECANEIINEGKSIFLNDFKRKTITSQMGHLFLKTVADYVQQATHKENDLKYVLFSAHDITIMSVMNTLGATMTEIPVYASHLNFSLYENDNNMYVKLSLNDSPVILPGHKNNTYPLNEFLEIANRS